MIIGVDKAQKEGKHDIKHDQMEEKVDIRCLGGEDE